jgi:hypothetical protein
MSEPTKKNWGILKEEISKVVGMDNDATHEVFEILDASLQRLLKGQPELSPQSLRWLRREFGWTPT